MKLSSCLKFTQRIKYLPIGVYRSRLIFGPDPPLSCSCVSLIFNVAKNHKPLEEGKEEVEGASICVGIF